jgi:DNA polymerase III subunit delta'
MRFEDIHGLYEVKAKLIAAVQNNHLAHALMFSGREGSMNLSIALALATYLHCEQPGDTDACGNCAACVKNSKYVHPDLLFTVPVVGSKKYTQDFLKEWREFMLKTPYGNLSDWALSFGAEGKNPLIAKEESTRIIQNLSLKAFESPYKIQVIWLPEMMNPSTANGLLKILEEPPAGTFFFLVTNDQEKILTTIQSRTQTVRIPLYEDDELHEYLAKKTTTETDRLSEVVQLANGNVRDALQMLLESKDKNHDFFVEWLRESYGFKFSAIVARTDKFNQLNRTAQQNMLQYGLSILREALIKGAGMDTLQRVTDDSAKFVNDFSKVLNPDKIEKMMSALNEASYHLERNLHAKVVFADTSFKLGAIMRAN